MFIIRVKLTWFYQTPVHFTSSETYGELNHIDSSFWLFLLFWCYACAVEVAIIFTGIAAQFEWNPNSHSHHLLLVVSGLVPCCASWSTWKLWSALFQTKRPTWKSLTFSAVSAIQYNPLYMRRYHKNSNCALPQSQQYCHSCSYRTFENWRVLWYKHVHYQAQHLCTLYTATWGIY